MANCVIRVFPWYARTVYVQGGNYIHGSNSTDLCLVVKLVFVQVIVCECKYSAVCINCY